MGVLCLIGGYLSKLVSATTTTTSSATTTTDPNRKSIFKLMEEREVQDRVRELHRRLIDNAVKMQLTGAKL
jgi:hypothetical protein